MSGEDIENIQVAVMIIIFLSAIIAFHQKTRGYSYGKSFVRSLIALTALAALVLKLFFV